MSWEDILKRPFYVDEFGDKQPTEDTWPEVVEMFERVLENTRALLDKEDLSHEEKIKGAIDELRELKTKKFKDFFLKRPLYNKRIKELEQIIVDSTIQLRNRPQREQSQRNWAADYIHHEVEMPVWIKEQEKKINQVLNDTLVDLGQEPKGTEFQGEHI